MRRLLGGFVVSLAAASAGSAQESSRSAPVGLVTGHVFCADTQRPARLAKVSLVTVPRRSEAAKSTDDDDSIGIKDAGDAVETSLDGGFILRNVRPGEYFLVVDMEGYVLPLAGFSTKELTHPNDATKTRIAKLLRVVDVEGNQTANVEVELERGAGMSGTATFDDGAPANGLSVLILSKDASGRWEEGIASRYRAGFGHVRTDDMGRFRVTGLPAGDYIAEVDLALNDYQTTTMPRPGTPDKTMTVRMQKTRFDLPLFSGNVWRKTAAVAFTLGTGEERSGADLQFALSKLHKVSGQLMAKDGHAINGGGVELVWADDQSKMTEAPVEYAESMFHLEFVPEGEFTLRSNGAKDVTRVQVENAPGTTPRFHEETKTVRTYGDAEQALIVQGDRSDVVLTIPEKGRAK